MPWLDDPVIVGGLPMDLIGRLMEDVFQLVLDEVRAACAGQAPAPD